MTTHATPQGSKCLYGKLAAHKCNLVPHWYVMSRVMESGYACDKHLPQVMSLLDDNDDRVWTVQMAIPERFKT